MERSDLQPLRDGPQRIAERTGSRPVGITNGPRPVGVQEGSERLHFAIGRIYFRKVERH